MAWPITWDDDTVADGSNLSSDSNWNVYHAGTQNVVSDEHDDHSVGGAGQQVMDGSNADSNPHWCIYDDIEPGTHIKVSTYVWPDREDTSTRNECGVLLRMQDNNPSANADVDGYLVRVLAAEIADDEFLLEVCEVTNGTATVLTSVDGLTTGTWSTSKDAFLLEVELENVSGDPTFTVTVDGTEEITSYADTSQNYTSAGYSGRYFARFIASSDAQPFTQDFDAEELSGSGPTAHGSVITIDGATFTRVGRFDMGGNISGAATFIDCGTVWLGHSDADLDGSTFRSPHGDHLLRLEPTP